MADTWPQLGGDKTLEQLVKTYCGLGAEKADGEITIGLIQCLETRAVAAMVVQILGSHGMVCTTSQAARCIW